jgi:hypothetical protein
MALPFLDVIAREALFEILDNGSIINTVNRAFESDVAVKGETVTVIMPETPAVQAAGAVPMVAAPATPTTATVTLDQWFETQPLSVDLKSLSIADRDVLSMYAKPIGQALLASIEAALVVEFAKFVDFIGNAIGVTTPTGIDGVAVVPKAKFDALGAPNGDRFVVAGPTLEAEYWKAFGLASQGGDAAVREQVSGFMGAKLGLNFLSSSGVEVGSLLGYAYHRNAVALASRPMQVSPFANSTMATVNYRGLGLTIEAWHSPDASADYIRGQVLYGIAAVSSRGFKFYKNT